jgi:4-hydroxythreonine-4-phosphate dehydrogenase
MQMKKNTVLQPRFAVTIGDPAGIGPEVAAKAVAKLPKERVRRLVLVGDASFIEPALKKSTFTGSLTPFDPEKLPPSGAVSLLDTATGITGIKRGKVSASSGRVCAKYIQTAVRLCIEGKLDGIVTAPINKKSLSLAGIPYPGHTELLADLTKTKNFAMMLVSPAMKVALLTTHLPLSEAAGRVKRDAIAEKIILIGRLLKSKKPIGVCGLNPHASDGGIFGHEEEKEILPAILEAKKAGIRVEGPLPADTIFAPKVRERYGAILAMYHDQGLVAIKAVSFGNCANVTLGLPFIRTSVDHGTAMDIAGKGKADPSSMIYAINTAFEMAKQR